MPIFGAYHLFKLNHNVTINSIVLQKCSNNMYDRQRIRFDQLPKSEWTYPTPTNTQH
jgi:hypothetical protein